MTHILDAARSFGRNPRDHCRNTALVGRELEALIRGPAYEPTFVEGHTEGNHPILLPAIEAPGPGLYRTRIEHATPHMLFGKVTETIQTSSITPVLHSSPVISSATL